MKIQESGENYLETILMLEQKNGTVRSIDIANELAFFQTQRQPRHEHPALCRLYYDG